MRRSLLIILITPLIIISAGNSGIKPKNASVSYFQHDRTMGLNKLESTIGHTLEIRWSELNSTPALISGKLTKPGYSAFSQWAIDGIRFISENKELFGLQDPAVELFPISTFTDELQMTHVKYEQRVNGLKVFHSDLIMHFNSDGSIESFNGTYIPTPEINLTPEISDETAVSIARSKINYIPSSQKTELVIYRKDNKPILAWQVQLPGKWYPNMNFFINAESSEIIRKDDGVRYDGPAKGKGIGLDGQQKNIETYFYGGQYYMIDASLPMYTPPVDSLWGVVETYDAGNDTAGNGLEKVVFVIDPNNDNNFNDNERLKAAVDAHYYASVVYKFYRTHYNRNSFNNAGGSLINIVHYKDKYNNAFWSGNFMAFGDGDGVYLHNPAGALDVIGHEITHGVVFNTAGLIYEEQSGALNESMADVFGALIDSSNWQMGEKAYTPAIAGDAMRDLSNPHNGQAYGDIMKGWQPEHMNEFMIYPNDEDHDWGGVHVNSGITNKAFYNAAAAIGHWKAGKIWYRALVVYLTKNSQFKDLAAACLNSAKDLYGQSSAEYKSVSDAFIAVGLGTPPAPVLNELAYDDGQPELTVYEQYPSWQLGVRFSPQNEYSVTQVQVYIDGDYYNGTGQYKLGIYKADPVTGLPGESWLAPTNEIPVGSGWQVYDIFGGGTYTHDFYVTVLYDGAGYPLIGADYPPGNGRAYEYDLSQHAWVQLAAPNDYTLFMRATVKSTTTEVEMSTEVPAEFRLDHNYPNPFNPSTTISYSLPKDTEVKMVVYDLAGNQVAELVNNYQNAGTYKVTWNGRNDSGAQVCSGIYYYTLQAGDFHSANKMLLIK